MLRSNTEHTCRHGGPQTPRFNVILELGIPPVHVRGSAENESEAELRDLVLHARLRPFDWSHPATPIILRSCAVNAFFDNNDSTARRLCRFAVFTETFALGVKRF